MTESVTLTQRQRLLLNCMSEKPRLTMSELGARMYGNSARANNVARLLHALKDLGMVEQHGPYEWSITDAGRALL